MPDPSRSPDTRDDGGADTGVEPDRRSTTVTSRWQKGVGIIGIVVVLGVGDAMLDQVLDRGPGGGGHAPPEDGGGHAPPEDGGGREGNTPSISGAPELAVAADELAFAPDRIELPAGMPVNVALSSADELHDLVVDEIDFHLAADRGETAVGGLVFLEPGTYVGYCSVPGHRDAGMEFEVVVTPSDGGHGPPPGVEHP